MPWTPAQRRLFGAQYSRGELTKKELKRRMAEGTRTDVTKTGHAKKRKTKRTTRRRSRRGTRR